MFRRRSSGESAFSQLVPLTPTTHFQHYPREERERAAHACGRSRPAATNVEAGADAVLRRGQSECGSPQKPHQHGLFHVFHQHGHTERYHEESSTDSDRALSDGTKFAIRFGRGHLGLQLHSDCLHKRVIIRTVLKDTLCATFPLLKNGVVVTAVNEANIEGLTYFQAIEELRKASLTRAEGQPMVLEFLTFEDTSRVHRDALEQGRKRAAVESDPHRSSLPSSPDSSSHFSPNSTSSTTAGDTSAPHSSPSSPSSQQCSSTSFSSASKSTSTDIPPPSFPISVDKSETRPTESLRSDGKRMETEVSTNTSSSSANSSHASFSTSPPSKQTSLPTSKKNKKKNKRKKFKGPDLSLPTSESHKAIQATKVKSSNKDSTKTLRSEAAQIKTETCVEGRKHESTYNDVNSGDKSVVSRMQTTRETGKSHSQEREVEGEQPKVVNHNDKHKTQSSTSLLTDSEESINVVATPSKKITSTAASTHSASTSKTNEAHLNSSRGSNNQLKATSLQTSEWTNLENSVSSFVDSVLIKPFRKISTGKVKGSGGNSTDVKSSDLDPTREGMEAITSSSPSGSISSTSPPSASSLSTPLSPPSSSITSPDPPSFSSSNGSSSPPASPPASTFTIPPENLAPFTTAPSQTTPPSTATSQAATHTHKHKRVRRTLTRFTFSVILHALLYSASDSLVTSIQIETMVDREVLAFASRFCLFLLLLCTYIYVYLGSSPRAELSLSSLAPIILAFSMLAFKNGLDAAQERGNEQLRAHLWDLREAQSERSAAVYQQRPSAEPAEADWGLLSSLFCAPPPPPPPPQEAPWSILKRVQEKALQRLRAGDADGGLALALYLQYFLLLCFMWREGRRPCGSESDCNAYGVGGIPAGRGGAVTELVRNVGLACVLGFTWLLIAVWRSELAAVNVFALLALVRVAFVCFKERNRWQGELRAPESIEQDVRSQRGGQRQHQELEIQQQHYEQIKEQREPPQQQITQGTSKTPLQTLNAPAKQPGPLQDRKPSPSAKETILKTFVGEVRAHGRQTKSEPSQHTNRLKESSTSFFTWGHWVFGLNKEKQSKNGPSDRLKQRKKSSTSTMQKPEPSQGQNSGLKSETCVQKESQNGGAAQGRSGVSRTPRDGGKATSSDITSSVAESSSSFSSPPPSKPPAAVEGTLPSFVSAISVFTAKLSHSYPISFFFLPTVVVILLGSVFYTSYTHILAPFVDENLPETADLIKKGYETVQTEIHHVASPACQAVVALGESVYESFYDILSSSYTSLSSSSLIDSISSFVSSSTTPVKEVEESVLKLVKEE